MSVIRVPDFHYSILTFLPHKYNFFVKNFVTVLTILWFRLQSSVEERLKKHLTITEVNIEEPEPEEDEVISLPEIKPEMDDVIKSAMNSRGQVSQQKMKDIKKWILIKKGLHSGS